MIRKEQMMMAGADKMSFVEQFYALAQLIHLVTEAGTSAHLKYTFLPLMRQNRINGNLGTPFNIDSYLFQSWLYWLST